MIKHIGFIMDGNRRYAKKQGMSIEEGYRKGMEKFLEFMSFQVKHKLYEASYFALSNDNYIKRPGDEKKVLYKLMEFFCNNEEIDEFIVTNKIYISLKGDIKEITKKEKKISKKKKIFIEKLEKKVKEWNLKNEKYNFKVNIALNYGGQAEILHSLKEILKKVKSGELKENKITEKTIKENLWFCENVAEIIVRPGNASRLSGFMLWDSAYSEIYLTHKLWPELDESDFLKIIEWYKSQKRNFGK
ncbi:MAG: di-trans,poly-cis-decaprenylcistransferase [Nanoarchaeota archaeon]|nr:di-trans,poly-cis-decaprenylcistransferase [Nanoarchaeota archaeon]